MLGKELEKATERDKRLTEELSAAQKQVHQLVMDVEQLREAAKDLETELASSRAAWDSAEGHVSHLQAALAAPEVGANSSLSEDTSRAAVRTAAAGAKLLLAAMANELRTRTSAQILLQGFVLRSFLWRRTTATAPACVCLWRLQTTLARSVSQVRVGSEDSGKLGHGRATWDDSTARTKRLLWVVLALGLVVFLLQQAWRPMTIRVLL